MMYARSGHRGLASAIDSRRPSVPLNAAQSRLQTLAGDVRRSESAPRVSREPARQECSGPTIFRGMNRRSRWLWLLVSSCSVALGRHTGSNYDPVVSVYQRWRKSSDIQRTHSNPVARRDPPTRLHVGRSRPSAPGVVPAPETRCGSHRAPWRLCRLPFMQASWARNQSPHRRSLPRLGLTGAVNPQVLGPPVRSGFCAAPSYAAVCAARTCRPDRGRRSLSAH
jgi:hypothetical protein